MLKMKVLNPEIRINPDVSHPYSLFNLEFYSPVNTIKIILSSWVSVLRSKRGGIQFQGKATLSKLFPPPG